MQKLLFSILGLLISSMLFCQSDVDEYLLFAAKEGIVDGVQESIKKNANINHKDPNGITALMKATIYDHPEIINILIKNGADLDLVDNRGNTALMKAAWLGNYDIVLNFTINGADVNIKNKWGETALTRAKSRDYKDIVGELISSGAVENQAEKSTQKESTALMLAVKNADVYKVNELISLGVDVNEIASNGATALFVAAENMIVPVQDNRVRGKLGFSESFGKYFEIAQLLHKSGANDNRVVVEENQISAILYLNGYKNRVVINSRLSTFGQRINGLQINRL